MARRNHAVRPAEGEPAEGEANLNILKSIGNLLSRAGAPYAYLSGQGAAGIAYEDVVDPLRVAQLQASATVYTCADLIAKAIADVTFTAEDEHWQRAFDRPNVMQSTYDYWYSVAWDSVIFGNCYVLRSAGKNGSQGMLAPLDPTKLRPKGDLMRPRYELTGGKTYEADRVIHIRHGGGSGLVAIGRVAGGYARIKALQSCDTEMHNVFDNGLNIGYVLHGGSADKQTVKKLLVSVRRAFGKDGKKRGGLVGLTGGFKLETIKGVTPADSDLRDLRTDLIREIAALFGIPPFAAGGSSDTKYSNVVARHQQIAKEALLPLAKNLASKFSYALETEVSFVEEDLLNGDFATRVELALKTAGGPVLSPNEARKTYLGRDTISGGEELRTGPGSANPMDDRRGELPADGSGSDV